MRLKRNRLNTYYHRAVVQKKDSEGSTYPEYDSATSFEAEMWPAGGKVQSQMYGLRLPMIRNLRIDGKYEEIVEVSGKTVYKIIDGPMIAVNDGICVNAASTDIPDYKVIAIYPYSYLALEVERQ